MNPTSTASTACSNRSRRPARDAPPATWAVVVFGSLAHAVLGGELFFWLGFSSLGEEKTQCAEAPEDRCLCADRAISCSIDWAVSRTRCSSV